ncbi:LPXTG cell wall anchor domain-containing protein, partial [Kitasatospora sp. NPDC093558]|uniref:LPXTG cell wall anchor domain-containing protein n=1 Tax=Kitasatospora sp. NPDC093558 TaxID=3155201 RepID=UPI0034302C63
GTPSAPAAAASPSTTPAPQAPAPQPALADAAQPAAPTSAQLASTGADHTAGLVGGGLALTALGVGALWLRRVLGRA